jgi:hypothetical protein
MGSVTQKKIRSFSKREQRKRVSRRAVRFFIGPQVWFQMVFQGQLLSFYRMNWSLGMFSPAAGKRRIEFWLRIDTFQGPILYS